MKTCANCAHDFKEIDNFCPSCGQENHQYNQSFKHLFMEFIEAELHFDNKFWLTAKSLFLRPGEITVDFIADKRARYVPPIRLYVFASALFFLVVSWLGGGLIHTKSEEKQTHHTEKLSHELAPKPAEHKKSGVISDFVRGVQAGMKDSINLDSDDTTLVQIGNVKINIDHNTSDKELDSLSHVDNLNSRFTSNFIKIFQRGDKAAKDAFMEHFHHLFAESLFVCMPLAAFLLYLIYIRRKRNYYEFLIFSVYFHSFVFILMIINKILTHIIGYFIEVDFTTDILALGVLVYFVISLKKVYGQGWAKTILKALIFMMGYSIIFLTMLLGIVIYLFVFSGGH